MDKSIFAFGLAVALTTAVAGGPARAEVVGGVFAGVTLGFGFGAIHSGGARYVEGYPVWDYGVPGYQRPRPVTAWTPVAAAGPGRHRVCAWQERYDRHENYVGSRRVCWIEAR